MLNIKIMSIQVKLVKRHRTDVSDIMGWVQFMYLFLSILAGKNHFHIPVALLAKIACFILL